MKKVASSVYVFAMVGILISSCSRFSDVSILKRHYRSGYYVENCSVSKPAQKESTKPQEPKQQVATAPVDKGDQQSHNEFRRLAAKDRSITIADRNGITESQTKKSGTVLSSIESPIKEMATVRKVFKESKITTLKHSYDGGEGHGGLGGLLWLIVVVLLILFLLNFLLTLNLGGLVYIILVVALILLLFRLIGLL